MKDKEYKIIYEENQYAIKWIISLTFTFILLRILIKQFYIINTNSFSNLEVWMIIGYLSVFFIFVILLISFLRGLFKWSKQHNSGEIYFKGRLIEIQEVKYPKEVKRKTKFKTIWKAK